VAAEEAIDEKGRSRRQSIDNNGGGSFGGGREETVGKHW